MELRLELEKHKEEASSETINGSESSEDEKNSVEPKVGWMKQIFGRMSVSDA
ncbi:hypothetical protein EUTSA_v10011930mg [Eutrema salsugineum]|uniref:Uncharacterized protein n=1 Tax=Eutrema salsugineum TaxID=72664 RepID=V4JYX3_EUTSA|nr:hypothetical protein EUTSA_v10011930mg [Eutrema salsugineum]